MPTKWTQFRETMVYGLPMSTPKMAEHKRQSNGPLTPKHCAQSAMQMMQTVQRQVNNANLWRLVTGQIHRFLATSRRYSRLFHATCAPFLRLMIRWSTKNSSIREKFTPLCPASVPTAISYDLPTRSSARVIW